MTAPIRVAVLGASGYTGADTVRLLLGHPRVAITALTADRQAGKPMAASFPHLRAYELPPLITVDAVDWGAVDAVFCCLPHGTTQAIVADLPAGVKVIDLSADFRLRDPDIYAEWYGHPHQALARQEQAVYGLTEHYRDAIAGADLVACPGCYPTAALLALLPLAQAGVVAPEDIIIDAKSGVSGAGRKLAEARLFTEFSEGFHAYGVGHHRHMPEIEQELSRGFGASVRVNFTPHLIPVNRGELVTCHIRLAGDATAETLHGVLTESYANEAFIQVLPAGQGPATHHVRGSNHCAIGVFADRLPGRAIVLAAIDNLVKGSAGQAVQNFNLMFGLPETMALEQAPLFP